MVKKLLPQTLKQWAILVVVGATLYYVLPAVWALTKLAVFALVVLAIGYFLKNKSASATPENKKPESTEVK